MKEKALTPGQVEGVGIGVPGPVQESSVVPIVCANLGGWGQQDVAANLSSLLGRHQGAGGQRRQRGRSG